jgi:hypothetical protein
MYVSTFDHNPVSTRDSFNNFINNYNINYLSFNFLPNEINKKVRKSIEIDEEIKYFESRINKISTSILEEQQNRSNFLLSIVSILASISSIQPIYEFLLKIQINFKINFFIFFSIISMLIIIGTISILIYLYPDDSKRVINRIKTLLKRK